MENMVRKNIFVIGAPRSGKTTLAKRIAREMNYNLISVDDLVSGFKNMTNFDVYKNGDTDQTARNIEPFMEKLLEELSEGTTYYNGFSTVIEGTYVDFERLIPFLRNDNLIRKYYIVGLTYNHITEEELYNNIKKYDTEDDWTYWVDDEDLKGDVRYFIDRNSYFAKKFKEYKIDSFDTSLDRTKTLDEVMEVLKDKSLWEEKHK